MSQPCGQRVGDQVLELAQLVAAHPDAGVDVLALGPDLRARRGARSGARAGARATVRAAAGSARRPRGPRRGRRRRRSREAPIDEGSEGQPVLARRPSAAPAASPAAQRSTIAACCSTERRPTSDPKRRRSRRRSRGISRSSERAISPLAAACTRTSWNASSAATAASTSPLASAAEKRSLAAAMASSSPLDTRATPKRRRQRVQRRDDLEGVLGIAAVERRHARVAVGRALDEAAVLQPRQGLADRRAADAQPRGQLGVAQLLAGLQRAVEDRVAQPRVGLVAQQHAGRDGLARRNWHVKYHTPLVKPQPPRPRRPSVRVQERRAATMHRNEDRNSRRARAVACASDREGISALRR